MSRVWNDALGRQRKRTQSKHYRKPLEAETVKEMELPTETQKVPTCQLFPMKLIVDF